MRIALEVFVIVLLVLGNGLFAMSEAALISARGARLQQMEDEGDARARTALDLVAEPNLFLSTVQIGITFVGVLAGAFGGATIANNLAGVIEQVPLLAPYAQAIALGLVVLAIAYLSLVVGELVPKRLALNSPERVASTVARPMRLLSRVAAPAVRLLSFSTDTVLRLLRARPGEEPPVTEAEISVLIDQGARAGVFEEAEKDMVAGVFRLGDLRVTALMTPRPEIVWLDLEDEPAENRRKMTGSVYSRFPVCRGNLDEVLGVVRAKNLLVRSLEGEDLDLTADLRTALFVPENMRVLQLLEAFRNSGEHLALVIDEYGEVEGVVTLNDVLEAIVGELPSADEPDEPQVTRREDGSWLLDGSLPADRLKELLQVKQLPGEDKGDFQTLAGFVMTRMGRLPEVAERFEWAGLRFEVIDMDGYRIDKVLVARAAEDEDAAPDRDAPGTPEG